MLGVSKWLIILVVGVCLEYTSRADLDETDLDAASQNTAAPQPVRKPSEYKKTDSAVKTETIRPDLNGDEEKRPMDVAPNPVPSDPVKPTQAQQKKSSNSLKAAPEDPEKARKEPVKLKSKGLKAHKDAGYVELSESVQLTQANLKMNSDYAKVFFDKESNEVSKAEILGNVHIEKESQFENERITADADRALFSNLERKITLQGNASLLKDGALLKGKKIIYDLTTGWITFEGAEGVMQQGQESKTKK
jgi:lipopolysaccharide transport protein LptA